jgi:LysM repeat protein
MATRRAGRFTAPLALVAVVVVIYILVHNNLDHHSHHAAGSSQIPGQLVQTTRQRARSNSHAPKFYVVRAGDTLSGISVKTGIPIATLQILNPSLDPNALQTGQRLRLRR